MSGKNDPDFVYVLEDWECTWPFDDRDMIADDMDGGAIREVGTLIAGPSMWVAQVPVSWDEDGDPEEWEVQWFDTKEAAEAAVNRKPEFA